jgi:hypothetical protein
MLDVKQNYTPWENLHKRADMDVGQIGYHNERRVSCLSWCCYLCFCDRSAFVSHAGP